MNQELETEVDYKHVLPSRYAAMLGDKIKKDYKVTVGPKSIFNQRLKSLNNTSYQSNFVLTPAPSQAISDYMIEEIYYSISLSFNNASGAAISPFNSTTLAISPFANYSVCNTLTTIFQDSTMTINQSQLIPLLSFNNDEHNLGTEFTGSCNLDAFTDVADIANSQLKVGSLRSLFQSYANDTFGIHGGFSPVEWAPLQSAGQGGGPPAGTIGFDNREIADGDTGIREIAFICRSPVWNGLNSMLSKDANCFTGITNYQLSKTMVPNMIQRLLRIGKLQNGVSITAMTLNPLTIAPVLYYNIYNFDNDIVPRPEKLFYLAHDYSNLQVQSLPGGNATLAGYATGNYTSQPVNLSNIPSAIYLYVGDYFNGITTNTVAAAGSLENSCAPGYQITSITIQYGGSNIIQNLNQPIQVYNELSASEGFMKTYAETGFTIDTAAVANSGPNINGTGLIGLYGSVLRIDCSKLGLNFGEHSNGQSFTLPISFQLTVTNLSSRDRTPYLYMQPIYDRLYVVENNNVVSTYNIVPNEVFDSIRNSPLLISKPSNMLGGRMLGAAWYNDLWDGIKSGASWIWKNRDGIADAAKAIAKVVGAKVKKTVHRGRGINENVLEYEGGKIIPKSELKNKLKFM